MRGNQAIVRRDAPVASLNSSIQAITLKTLSVIRKASVQNVIQYYTHEPLAKLIVTVG
jgi:hypothetical protein